MAKRRELRFQSIDEIMPDVDRLAADHQTVGNWSLGQICKHLATTFRYSLDGFPPPLPPWLVRKLVAPMIFRKIMKEGHMAEGIKVPDYMIPQPGVDDPAEVESLRQALARYQANTAGPAEHPFFGKLTREQWDRLHCIHCAHHLSFALPNSA